MSADSDGRKAEVAAVQIVVPPHVLGAVERLQSGGHQAVLVGGCVRDSLLGCEPKDWDVATDAVPSRVQELFPHHALVGAAYGTVLVLMPEPIEVTTFRRDLEYADGRRPVCVAFTDSLAEDLKRRDFTINSMAFDPLTQQLTDPNGGVADLEARLIRTVGEPVDRFREDALRMLRAVRFSCRLDFDISTETWDAMVGLAPCVGNLSRERVRDELLRILATSDPGRGLWILYELGMLFSILPELRGSDRMAQGKRGAPTLLDHLIQTAAACPEQPVLRITALLHDVGKLSTRQVTEDGRVAFPRHESESTQMAVRALRRLRLPSHDVSHAASLIKYHMSQGEISRRSLRRWLSCFGPEWVRELLALRRADHLASGGEQAPWLDAAEAELADVLATEVTMRLSDLAVDGRDVMGVLGVAPGPIVGYVLRGMFELVLTDPNLNTRETLLSSAQGLAARFAAEGTSSGQTSLG